MSFSFIISKRGSRTNRWSHQYNFVFIGSGGSIAQSSMSAAPSLSETFPQNNASPFSGVFLYSCICLIIFSSAVVTFFLTGFDFIFYAVLCSLLSCAATSCRLYPTGTYTVTSSVCLPFIASSIFISFLSFIFFCSSSITITLQTHSLPIIFLLFLWSSPISNIIFLLVFLGFTNTFFTKKDLVMGPT